MSPELRQMIVLAVVGCLVLLVVVRLSRKGLLSFRYTLGWIGVAGVGILAGLFAYATEPIASIIGLSPTEFIMGSSFTLLVFLSIQLSISISGMQKHIRSLTEEIALLKRVEPSVAPNEQR